MTEACAGRGRRDPPRRGVHRGALGQHPRHQHQRHLHRLRGGPPGGVPRVVFASSNHAVGFTPRRFPVPENVTPRRTRTTACPRSPGRRSARCTTPLRAGRHLPPDPDLLRAAADHAHAVHLAVAGRRRAAVRGLPRPRSGPGTGSSTACRPTPAAAGSRWTGRRALGYEPAGRRGGLRRQAHRRARGTDPDDPVFAYLGGEFMLPDSTRKT